MRDLYVLMAELATAPENRHKLQPGLSSVTPEMVAKLETMIDTLDEQFEHPTEFVVPGERQMVMPSIPFRSVTLASLRTMKPWPS